MGGSHQTFQREGGGGAHSRCRKAWVVPVEVSGVKVGEVDGGQGTRGLEGRARG